MRFQVLLLVFLCLVSSRSVLAETELEKADRLLKAGDPVAAQGVLGQLLKSEPQNAQAHFQLGRTQFRSGKNEEAVASVDKAIALQPAKADFHVLRGNILGNMASNANVFRAMGLAEDGLASLQKAVQLEPGNRDARAALFNWYHNVPRLGGGGADKALALVEETIRIDPGQGHYLKALVHLKQKHYGVAQTEARSAVAADPKLHLAYNILGYAALELKQFDQALADFQKQVELAPEDPNSHDSLGDGFLAKGLLPEAIGAYRKGLEVEPRFWACAGHLGKALERAKRKDEAIAHYRRYVQLGSEVGNEAVVSMAQDALERLGVN
ncbi:MAG: tetratricopeptide repeat protein [Xanthomonadales bacterium]|nr:tetratricopeptide repeat protein [Xanthomonadales bacterium]